MGEQREVWVVRVAQEFRIEATVEEAYAFMRKAAARKIKGAYFVGGRGVIGPAGEGDATHG